MENTISLDKDTYESIVAEQLDPYLFIRDAYLQRRAAQVNE
jgi:phospholipid-binding lipoprotein MlaA